MRLKNRSQVPVGGYYYDDPIKGRRINPNSSFEKLLEAVRSFYRANDVEEPANLAALIEDQICTRQPPDTCYYTKGTGDTISKIIHKAAGLVDKVLKTNLEPKARRCGGCSRRRTQLNSR